MEQALRLCLDFINTEGRVRNGPPDRLDDLGVFVQWAADEGMIEADSSSKLLQSMPEGAVRDRFLAAARDFREALYRIFAAAIEGTAPKPADIAILNRRLAPAMQSLSLTWEEGKFLLGAPEPETPDDLLSQIASSAAHLVRSDKLERVKECSSDTCASLFIDESKNRSRRWCDMSDCGNKAKARRFYRRSKEQKRE